MSEFRIRADEVKGPVQAERIDNLTQHFYNYPRSPSGKPLQRPERVENFINRKRELAKLLKDIMPGRVLTLCGPGGIGKTALASEAVWRLSPGNEVADRFPDGIIFHSFYGHPEISLAFEHIVRSFDEESRDTSQEAAFRLLARKQALLILDGTEDTKDLQKVLAIRGNCGVIVTSRQKKDALARREDIRPLPTDEAVRLLRAWGGDPAADENAARQICELLGGLPLAGRLAGRYLNQTGEPAPEYLEWLAETPLEALDHGNRRLESVPLLIRRSLEPVSETAREILGVCGLLSFSPFTREVVSAALPDIQIRQPLNQLIFYGLVQRTKDRFEISHALIHTYARTELSPDDAALKRLAEYYETFASEQSKKGLKGYARLDPERAHIVRVIKECGKRKEWQGVSDLVWAVDSYLYIRGYWTERLTSLESGIIAARNLKGRYDEGAFLGNLGVAYSDLGQIDKAIGSHEQALEISREIGDRRNEGSQLGNLGNVYNDLGQIDKAIEYYEQALEISREIGDRREEGADLGNLGVAYSDLGQIDKAIGSYEQALAISREIGDRRGEGRWLDNLGNAYNDLGQIDKAIEYYEQALEISREIGDRRNEGNNLGNLGIAYINLGQTDKAIEYHEQALEITKEIRVQRDEGSRLGNLGKAYLSLGQTEKAIEYYEQALEIAREIEDRKMEGNILNDIAIAYRDLGQTDKAIEYHEQALEIFRKIGNRRGEGSDLGNLGIAYYELGQVKKVVEYLEQALAIGREIGDRRGEGIWLNNLGEAYEDLGQTEKARQYYQQALVILEEIKSPHAEIARKNLAALDDESE